MSARFFATGVVAVAKRDPAHIRARKEASPYLTRVSAGAGLGSLAALGAGTLMKKPGRLLRVKNPAKTKARGEKLVAASTPAGIVGAGVGGISGFNSAGIQRYENRKLAAAKKPVVKARDFNPEERRQRRNKTTSWGLGVGAGGAGAFGAHQAYQGGQLVRTAQNKDRASNLAGQASRRFGERSAAAATAAERAKAAKKRQTGHLKAAGVNATRAKKANARATGLAGESKLLRVSSKVPLKRGRAGLITGAALGAAAVANERHRRNHGKPYGSWYDQHPAVKKKKR